MTGLEVYRHLRSHREQAPFSAILMSAQFPVRLLDIPALIYMQKPFEMDVLLQTMEQLMESASEASS